jgi:dephospho-CoA kinase
MADHVIDNSGSLEETRAQVVALVAELTEGRLAGQDPQEFKSEAAS